MTTKTEPLCSHAFNALKEFCQPDGNECKRWGDEVYWVSNGRANQEHPIKAYQPLSVVAYVREGNESPLIECGWIIRDIKKYQLQSQSVLPFYNLATIKVFCSDEKAWEIAKDIKEFLEGYLWP